MSEKDAAQQEREMREHEREARERDPDERSSDGDTSTDPHGGAEPAPPGNVQSGGQSG
jgi:hypothetical protein